MVKRSSHSYPLRPTPTMLRSLMEYPQRRRRQLAMAGPSWPKSYSKQFLADFPDGFLPFQIGIVGVGYAGFDSMTPGLSTRELMFEAATRAYEDAGIDPRKDVQSFVCCTEDFWEGISISDEY